jgi:hypothetical protein
MAGLVGGDRQQQNDQKHYQMTDQIEDIYVAHLFPRRCLHLSPESH